MPLEPGASQPPPPPTDAHRIIGRGRPSVERCGSCGGSGLCDCRVYLAGYGIPTVPLGVSVEQPCWPFWPSASWR